MPRILVTGGAGFIGSWVVKSILRADPDSSVTVVDSRPVDAGAWGDPRVSVAEVDLRNRSAVASLFRDTELCIHCVLGWGADVFEMVQQDVSTTAFLATEAARSGHRKFIYTSSINAVGIRSREMDEETACRPDNLYSATKAASEALLAGWSRTTGFPCAVIRPAYTFGLPATSCTPSQPAKEFPEMMRKILAGETVRVTRSEGAQFLPVEDLADMYVRLIGEGEGFQAYNVAGDRYYTWREIADMAIGLTGSTSSVEEIPGRFPDPPNRFSASKAVRLRGRGFDAAEALGTYLRFLAERCSAPAGAVA